ncbi:MAG: neutral/alkaline non-lysosomal ceramidase N-terminal domain-containing protein [Limnochordia bacterium]|jgi:neutral ceramidase
MPLQASVAKVNITPAIGCAMAGYAGRKHGAVGIRDELWARALYLTDAKNDLVLLGIETVGISADVVGRVRRRVEEETGIPASNVFVAATHTHSGPNIPRSEVDTVTANNVAVFEDKLVGVVAWAKSMAAPARVFYRRGPAQCGINRREKRDGRIVLGKAPDQPVYPWVDILQITDLHGETKAVWFCHPCHAVVLGQNNYLISGDFPGAAARHIEEQTEAIAIFANGCAGNINSDPHGADFDAVDKLGRYLGAAVMKELLSSAEGQELTPSLSSLQHSFLLPADSEGIDFSVHAVRIGELALLGLPAEVFVELGMSIQKGSPFPVTIPVGYANGYQGYIPTARAFEEGGYEVGARIRRQENRITADAPAVVVAESLKALHKLKEVAK